MSLKELFLTIGIPRYARDVEKNGRHFCRPNQEGVMKENSMRATTLQLRWFICNCCRLD